MSARSTDSGGWARGKAASVPATLYLALMTDYLLEKLGAQADVIVDGPLAHNPVYGKIMAVLRPRDVNVGLILTHLLV